MSQIEWYYARDNKQLGPVSSVELKRLATAGSLGPDDLVWREGMTEWAAARNVRGLFDEEGRAVGGAPAVPAQTPAASEAPAAPVAATAPTSAPRVPSRHLFDMVMDNFRPIFGPKFIETTSRVLRQCGSYGLFAAVVLTVLHAVVAATIAAPVEHLLQGAIWVVVLLTLQYVAGKFCDGVERLNRETTGSLALAALPDCFAMLFKVAGAVALLGSIAVAVETSEYALLLPGVAAFLILIFLSIVAMHPTAIGISIAPETLPGGEAIGVVLFLMKSLLRLVPVAFGVGVVCGTLLLGYAAVEALSVETPVMLGYSTMLADSAWRLLFYSAVLPLAAYLTFLLVNLVVHIWRSILSLPGKLDALAERKPEEEKKPE